MPSTIGARPGIHSIGDFSLIVPSLKEAEAFYDTFGLIVENDGRQLVLHTADGTRWGSIVEGERKSMRHLTLHCYADDFGALREQLRSLDVTLCAAPLWHDAHAHAHVPAPAHAHAHAHATDHSIHSAHDSLWLRDPDGLLLEVRVGQKTSPHAVQRITPPPPVDGIRAARYRRQMAPVRPTRLSHLARLTTDVNRLIDFYTRVLGMRLSDRSGDHVAFLHGCHGSDHHLLAFAASTGAALHHLSWDVPTVDDVGLGAMNMMANGYTKGWGVGRHVLGSNYFYYAEDPWGSFCEYSSGMDFIPSHIRWEAIDHPAEDAFFLWGPDVPPQMLINSEAV
jgi:catechol 2,3-dioxygenase-like lactoylglutathione lyase family enzyme